MIHASDILAKVFSTSKFREGYEITEVDDFLDALAANYRLLDGLAENGDSQKALELSPQLVVDHQFSTVRFAESYDMSEVDVFLDAVVADLHERHRAAGVVGEAVSGLTFARSTAQSDEVTPDGGAESRFAPTAVLPDAARFPSGMTSFEVISALQFGRIGVVGSNKDQIAVRLPDGSHAGISEIVSESDGIVIVLKSPHASE